MDIDLKFWAGTDETFELYLAALKRSEGLDLKAYHDREDSDEEPSRLLTMQGNVAVISINGPLVPGNNWLNEYRGVTGYGEIREALVQAATNPEAGAILLDINSGGGAVNGVTDVADLIRKIDTTVKPVHAYSDGMIASAALWTGVSARRLTIGKVAEAGSIGILVVHKEVTKMMKDAGITPTVLRAGEFKALGGPYEALSDKAKTVIQGQLDQMYAMFAGYVAQRRGVSYETADTQMGQGRMFIGDRALAVGLVDGVSNFDDVVSQIQGAIDSEKSSSQYGASFLNQKGPGVKTALTEQQIAAMAEGGTPAAGASVDTAATSQQTEAGASDQAGQAEGDSEKAAQTQTQTQTQAAAQGAQTSGQSELVAFLQTQLAEAQAKQVALSVEVSELKASKEALQGSHAAMRAIAVASVDRLKVALGGSAGASQALTDDVLLAEHASLRAQFENKFKAGGVAAVSSSGSSEKSVEQTADPVRLARINATRPAK